MKKQKAKPIEPGDRFGNLTAIVRIPNSRKWHCLCDCGQSTEALSGDLNKKNGTQSCGCLQNSLGGLTSSQEYMQWYSAYKDKWPDFLDFWTELGPRPQDGFFVTAIDTEKPLGPGNAYWSNNRHTFGETEIRSFEGLNELIMKNKQIAALNVAAYEAKKDPTTFEWHLNQIEKAHMPKEDLVKQQEELEQESRDTAKAQWLRQQHQLDEKGRVSQSDVGKDFIHRLVPLLAHRLNENVELAQKRLAAGGGAQHGSRYYTLIPRLRTWLTDYEIAYVTLACVMDAVGRGATAKCPLAKLYTTVGERLDHQMFLAQLKDADPTRFKQLEKDYLSDATRTYKRKVYAVQYVTKDDYDYQPLEVKEQVALGDWATQCLSSVTSWFESTLFKPDKKSNKTVLFLTLTPEGLKHRALIEAGAAASKFTINPMICPPKDWASDQRGGYLKAHPGGVAKLIHGNKGTELGEEAFQALNALQQVPWRVNRLIYEVQKELIATTNEIGAFKSYEKDSWMDQNWVDVDPKIWSEGSEEEQKKARRQITKCYDNRALAEKQRIIPQRILETAATFVNFKQIFLPMFVDARGRMYYMCDTLNPQGSEATRALLEFADGTPVTDENFEQIERELLINLANTWDKKEPGLDRKTSKLTFDDRVRWAREFAADLEHVVDGPLESEARKIWVTASEPFLFLATLAEYWNVCIRKTQKTAHAPLALDATNSGSQIIGGILRNEKLCHFTNVVPSDDGLPQDMYGEIARYAQGLWQSVWKDQQFERINQNRLKAAQKINAEREKEGKTPDYLAKIDYGSILKPSDITRTIAKRASMVSAYGGSFGSKHGYVKQELEEAGFTGKNRVGYVEALTCSNAIIQGQDNAFPILDKVNEFFMTIGKLCLGQGQEFVEWVTPTGSLIRQEYREPVTVTVRTHAMGGGQFHRLDMNHQGSEEGGDETSMITIQTGYGEVMENKTSSALAANAIHSIDASLACIAINSYGGPCGFIHDCLVAPPGQTFKFAGEIRKAYHRCITSDVLKSVTTTNNLTVDQVLSNIPEDKQIEFGTVDINDCLRSEYMFC